ncbi:hypothetical protein Barb4_01419 [Bacteroidales bacterium Barb4]|nr:hypothetical protein Barb4_01419 [Bacteroidales bacterium Barb4]
MAVRFHGKTKQASITTSFRAVVMLLLFITFASCGKDAHKEVIEMAFDPEQTYTMRTTNVSSLISDSGITRFRLNAKEVLMFDQAAEPYMYFPEGIYIERFDTLFNTEASVRADTAYQWNRKGLAKLIGNVEMNNLEGERFQTELLYWDRNEKRFYSDACIRIERHDRIITGIGFESNENMTAYWITHPQGTIPVSETKTVAND